MGLRHSRRIRGGIAEESQQNREESRQNREDSQADSQRIREESQPNRSRIAGFTVHTHCDSVRDHGRG